MKPQVIWYKRDLRILDHASLFHAAKQGHVIPLYSVEPFLFERDYLTTRHLHFIYESLLDLKASLRSIGLDLYLYIGDALSCFELLKEKLHTFDIHAHMEHGTTLTYERDMRIHTWCETHALTFHEYPNFGVKRAKDFKYRLRDFHGWFSEGVYPVPKDATLYRLDDFGIQDIKDILNVKAKGHPITWLKGGEKEAM